MTTPASPRILIVRRDNIGDLVCTTPLIRALRERYPSGWLGALVNSYNAPVLDGNPDLDEVFVYTKAKHRAPGESLPGIYWRRLRMMLRLRAMKLDEVILAAPTPQPRGLALARWLAPKRIVGFGAVPGLDAALSLAVEPITEVEDVFRMARLHGIDGPPPACRVVPPAGIGRPAGLTVAIHISARKPSQRWPVERFAELMATLRTDHGARFTLLWSPGAADNPQHPGDDDKAAALLKILGEGFPVDAVPTATLPELIAALARCHAMICADGGAMHLAAGLGLPIVCLFGDSGAERWRPWGGPYRLLQKPSRQVADIGADEVVAAFNALRAGIPVPAP
ncbi:MAG: glycosyltransferase family 9 protein [Sterolibacteriaceae bacterium MAG5]|nr:glycosyltransferase family 9 protein [Candidatus Nitricoxidireducens bremensis]